MKKGILILFTIVSLNLASQITVNENITENTVWNVDTVYVIDDLLIAEGVTLQINAGTDIIVSINKKFQVLGAIMAIGTADQPIFFTVSDTTNFWVYDGTEGGWSGIEYPMGTTQTETSQFTHCHFSFGKAVKDDINGLNQYGGAFNIYAASEVIFENCLFNKNIAYSGAGAVYSRQAGVSFSGCQFKGNIGYRSGGGAVYFNNVNLVEISNCSFEENKAYYGGAIYAIDADSVMIDSCKLLYNYAMKLTNVITNRYGGAIMITRGRANMSTIYAEITNSIIQYSRSTSANIYLGKHVKALLKNNNISYNWASNTGGAIGNNSDGVDLRIIGNIITNNEANSGSAIMYYGGSNFICGLHLTNNLFANNYGEDNYGSSTGFGGGAASISAGDDPVFIANNTFVNNRHNYMGGALHLSYCRDAKVVNNIFDNNSAPNAPQIVINTKGAANDTILFPDFSNNLIQAGQDSIGVYRTYAVVDYDSVYRGVYLNNRSDNPDFVQPSAGIGFDYDGQDADWSLLSSSSCINAGDSLITTDSLGTEIDLAGNPRIYMSGTNDIIDMGSYEFQGVASAIKYQHPIYLPQTMSLSQNYPNPFNPLTTICYNLASNGQVELTIYNIIGEKVSTLVHSYQKAGSYTVKFDGTSLPSGIYFYKLNYDGKNQIQKMTLIK